MSNFDDGVKGEALSVRSPVVYEELTSAHLHQPPGTEVK